MSKIESIQNNSLIKSSIYNLLGLGLPMLIGLLCIPRLIFELGEARFGLLSLIWAVVSYFNMFDLGLGRSLTHSITSALHNQKKYELQKIVDAGLFALLFLGLFGGLLLGAIGYFGVSSIKLVPDLLEAKQAAVVMALAIPAIVLTSGYRGILEAFHEFGVINSIRVPMGVWTFLSPLVVINCGKNSLVLISGVLVFGRYLGCFACAYFAKKTIAAYKTKAAFNMRYLKPLLVTGGWMTLGNLISSLIGYMDRFVIGAILSASAVAYYTTPQEIVTKLWILPGAITLVLFPTFTAKILSNANPREIRNLFFRAINVTLITVIPIALTLGVYAEQILSFWISEDFSKHSAFMMLIFSIGVTLNSIAQVPFILMQSAGFSRMVFIIYLIQLPLFIAILLGCIKFFGVEGAAYAWLLRLIIDSVMMFSGVKKISIGLNEINLLKLLMPRLGLILSLFYLTYTLDPLYKSLVLLSVFFVCLGLLLREHSLHLANRKN